MSSADMCQCAGCFESRMIVERQHKKQALREKIEELKKKHKKIMER